ncbi:MAG: IS1634 family transposase [Bacteroidales bacterium]|nr:IS1634 family transposase [Bacteroidales bacterium]MDY4952186.1 IS1634 family transposase [Prevotella sp.]
MYLKYVRRESHVGGKALTRKYYRLTESYRDSNGKARQHMLLALGYLPELPTFGQRDMYVGCLNSLVLHGEYTMCDDEAVSAKVQETYDELRSRGLIDKIVSNSRDVAKAEKAREEHERRCGYVTAEGFFGQKLTDARPVGMENVCLSILGRLGLEQCLMDNGLSREEARLALVQVAARVIFPCSEHRTAKYLRGESALCEMAGVNSGKITKDALYGSARRLYGMHREIEDFLHDRVVSMFDIHEKIYLLDLSNTYFEGRYTLSDLLARGRSKEKRTDCKQVVFGAVVNTDGLLVRTDIFEGNAADYKCMQPMIDALKDGADKESLIIVMDAGMSGVGNIKWLKDNHYKYITVMRGDNTCTPLSERIATVRDEKGQDIRLRLVKLDRGPAINAKTGDRDDYTGDTFLLVDSYAKAMKEKSMADRTDALFVEGLKAMEAGLHKRGGTKKRDKVLERLGRLEQKTGTAHLNYDIHFEYDGHGTTTGMAWRRKDERVERQNSFHGKYIVRTNITEDDEETIWSYYNVIRTVETVFRVLKSDLDIRPVYHKSDEGVKAHLHLAILAYWVVSTARYMLRKGGIRAEWWSLRPVMNKQIVATSTARLNSGEYISVRKCSEPEEDLLRIYDTVRAGHIPIKTRKFVWTQNEYFKKNGHWKSGG